MSNIDKHNTPHVLIVAALAEESYPFIKMLHRTSHLSHNCVVGSWDKLTLSVLTCGVGFHTAEKLTSAALKQSSFDCILNVGTCGSLTEQLPIGSVCDVSSIQYKDAPTILIKSSTSCRLATVSKLVATRTAREELRQIAEICDMEAYSITSVAQKQAPQTPLHLFKVVSDLAGAESDHALNIGSMSDRITHFKTRAKQLSSLRLLPHTQAWLSSKYMS